MAAGVSKILLVFALFVTCYSSNGDIKCGPTEVYSNCIQCTRCYMGDCPRHQKCDRGCNCKPYYLRNEKGDCVPIEDCFIGVSLPPRSEILLKQYGCIGNAKTVTCLESCIGKKLSTSILRKACQFLCCPQLRDKFECGPNQEYTTCISCTKSCYYTSGTSCIKSCRSGCQCGPGYLLNHNNVCVPAEDCFPVIYKPLLTEKELLDDYNCISDPEVITCLKRCSDKYRALAHFVSRGVCKVKCKCIAKRSRSAMVQSIDQKCF